MRFPQEFLEKIAKERNLTDAETEIFLKLCGEAKSRQAICDDLNISESAFNTRLSGVYKKFYISVRGPVKQRELERYLQGEFKRYSPNAKADEKQQAGTEPEDVLSDALIQRVREHCRQKILNQHSRMRLLGGEEIRVDQLYVDVYLLNRSPRTFQVSENKLLENFDLRNDRLGLGNRIKRNSGFEVANKNSKLLILGKPGSGKTTFLKHLAVDWCKGQFQPSSIAVFIELRRIRDGQWNLIEAIDQELGLENWNQFDALDRRIQVLQVRYKKKSKELQDGVTESQKALGKLQESVNKIEEFLKTSDELQKLANEIEESKKMLDVLPLASILNSGKLLVLMDGLDEVPTIQLRYDVQNQLQKIANDYSRNRLIFTCRTQIIKMALNEFVSVEVAEFNEKQTRQFVQNWFKANDLSDEEILQQCETFDHAVNCNLALKELTITPVLLNLICLVLHDEGEIPAQRDSLYRKGIKLLLSQWNDKKNIEEWEVESDVYRNLKLGQKEALLVEIAARKFENSDNFVLFQQKEISMQITRFLRLTNFREGVSVLRAIEAQHGLLIERVDGLWSFSHLTFQEYFTVQWLTQLPPEKLVEKITNQQWQNVIVQLVKSQQPADRLLRRIKHSIDQSIALEPGSQKFLVWLFEKTQFTDLSYEGSAMRAFYYSFFALGRAFALARDLARDLDKELDRDLAYGRDLACDHDMLVRDLDLILVIALDLSLIIDRAFIFAHARDLDLDLDRAYTLGRVLDCALTYAREYDFVIALQNLRAALPAIIGRASFEQWWQDKGGSWIQELRQVMIEHRNISHDWQFTGAQNQQLKQYYDANKFLVSLLKIKDAASDPVREEIEDSLLLPWDELKRRHPDTYRDF